MKRNNVTTLKVAATYIGTIVGAGFATGQEVMQFFTRFGTMGLMGLALTTVLFMYFGYIIMDLGYKLSARSHLEIIKFSGGAILGTIVDLLITFILFGSFTAMIAGTGALFTQQFNLPSSFGNILMALLTALTVLTGINGVINSISFVVPFLLVAVVGTSVFSIINAPTVQAAAPYVGESSLINNWLLAAILYVSYNTIISISILGPLGSEASDRKVIRNGAILGGFGLGLGAIMINLALINNLCGVANLEVPMIYIAGRISYPIQIAYAVILTAEVYTTAVGSLYGFVSRIAPMQEKPITSRLVIAVTTVAALLASQFGFSNFVKYLYPLEGYFGIVMLISLVYAVSHEKK